MCPDTLEAYTQKTIHENNLLDFVKVPYSWKSQGKHIFVLYPLSKTYDSMRKRPSLPSRHCEWQILSGHTNGCSLISLSLDAGLCWKFEIENLNYT